MWISSPVHEWAYNFHHTHIHTHFLTMCSRKYTHPNQPPPPPHPRTTAHQIHPISPADRTLKHFYVNKFRLVRFCVRRTIYRTSASAHMWSDQARRTVCVCGRSRDHLYYHKFRLVAVVMVVVVVVGLRRNTQSVCGVVRRSCSGCG